MASPIFADNHSTTPQDPAVTEGMVRAMREAFGNPSSAHAHGRASNSLCEWARAEIAALLGGMGADPRCVVFTSGATEANNLALKSGLRAQLAQGKNEIVTTAIEHSSVLEVCKILGGMGGPTPAQCRLTVVPVGASGVVDPDAVRAAITPRTALVSVMHANNEVGTVQPVEAIGQMAHAAGALMHVDACQSFGRVPLDLSAVDLATVSGHKMYGPKGVGALYVCSDLRPRMNPEVAGGIHEAGLRAGTLNAPSIYGFGIAAAEMGRQWPTERVQVGAMRDALWSRIAAMLGPEFVRWNGTEDRSRRLPGNLNFTLVGVCPTLFNKAIEPLVSLSGAAACKGPGASHVLEAMGGVGDDGAAVRIGLGRFSRWEEIDAIAQAVASTARRLYGSGCPVPEK